MRESSLLFGGELVVKGDGIFTFAHYYDHPETKVRVIIVGMNHAGDQSYFEEVAQILEEAEIVLYEGRPSGKKGTDDEIKKEEEDLKSLASDDIDDAFYSAMALYFRVVKFLGLISENSAFDYNKACWESGDAEFFGQLENDEKMRDFLAQRRMSFGKITYERKKEIVEFVKAALKSMEEGRFSKKDFGDGFVFFWSDQNLVDIFSEIYGKSRDEIVMKRFDKIVQKRNPSVIGIKFGAAHLSYQRKLLEDRGYCLLRSIELKNIAF